MIEILMTCIQKGHKECVKVILTVASVDLTFTHQCVSIMEMAGEAESRMSNPV